MSLELKEIYKNFKTQYSQIKNIQIFYKKFKINPNEIPITSSYFFPSEIQNYIKKYLYILDYYEIKLKNKNINLKIYKNNQGILYNKKIDILKVILIISLLLSYSNLKCEKDININIFFTPFKKKLPHMANLSIDPVHVNTGFTIPNCYGNNEITIYRYEEWIKVMTHELIHNLNLDFSTMNINDIKTKLQKKYYINSKFDLFETYTEVWAEIIYIALISFIPFDKINNEKEFLKNFNNTMDIEKQYSINQANKIFKFYENKEYYENTNVFCYYILKSLLINNWNLFLKWCKKNNQNLINFKKTKQNLNNFLKFILNLENNILFKSEESYNFIHPNDSLRMLYN